MYRAMIANDIPALYAVLDDSFVLVHMTGISETSEDYLRRAYTVTPVTVIKKP